MPKKDTVEEREPDHVVEQSNVVDPKDPPAPDHVIEVSNPS